MELKNTPHIDKIIDYQAFIDETGLDENTIKELYQVFHDEILAEKEKLVNSYSQNDLLKLGKTVHNIKGISGSFKAGHVFEQACSIDLDIKNRKFQGMGDSLETFSKSIDCAVMDIRGHFDM